MRQVRAMVAVVLAVSAVTVGTASGALAGPLPAVAPAATSTSPAWTKLTPATSPSAREGSLSAFDPATGQLVLYGGTADFFAAKSALFMTPGLLTVRLGAGT